jgi:RNA polymerase sigma-70 factor, ECF subfamily
LTTKADRATAEAVASAVAAERTRMVASLIRLTGDWDLAEDCVQDAAERALVRWPDEGMPRSPAAWLTTAARNRALDVLRRRQTERAKLQERAIMDEMGPGAAGRMDTEPDDRLRLIFTCCHPALAIDGRVALTLKTVAGLGTAEIARAFLVSEPTMSQRLLRTRRKIADAAIPYRVPPDELLAERISGVLAVLYLIFNQGHGQHSDHLAVEALRLARLLVDLMPGEDEARGLLALVSLQMSRRRFDAHGDLVPMEEQDRSRWDAALIEGGALEPAPGGELRASARALPIAGTDRGLPRNGGSPRGYRLGHHRHPLRRPARRPAVTGDRLESGHRRRFPRRLPGRPGGA